MKTTEIRNKLRLSQTASAISLSLINSKTNRIQRQEIKAEETFVENLRKEVEKHGTAIV